MFKFLENIDESVYNRYKTVKVNIKAKSNSFYDSYLDLLESLVKNIAISEDLDYSIKDTCGKVLKMERMKELLINSIGLDKYTYDKLCDYTAKVNKHKHVNEKNVSIDAVVNYMRVFFDFSVKYAEYKNINVTCKFDMEGLISMFGETDREHELLHATKRELEQDINLALDENKLKENDILIYRELLASKSNSNMALEDQNTILSHQISMLKDIKLNTVEVKLNRALDMLCDLQESVKDNRILSYAVASVLIDEASFEDRIEKTRVRLLNER